MVNEIKYIGYYDTADNYLENRVVSLAATNKMDYICRKLNELGYRVSIISPSKTKDNRFYKGKNQTISQYVSLKLFPTFPRRNIFQKLFRLIIGDIMLVLYLLRKCKPGETIMAYHSVALVWILLFVKRIKHLNLILEGEEIYSDVSGIKRHRKLENRIFSASDAFLFPTELLNQKLNPNGKPYAIIHGTYQAENDRVISFVDDKIHVVYSGTFDPRKGGALAAAAAAEYLPEQYHLHVLGFGSESDASNLLKQIENVSRTAKASVTYDGLLSGEDFIRFLQKCDIGLSTQSPDAAFNDTSFPSKILTYMANGLRVVSIRIKAIETSAVGKYIDYYETSNPQAIAEAIMAVDLNESYDSREVIRELDVEFIEDLEALLKA